MAPKISVIITIYNREKYIEACARSLFEQKLKEIEYIFIDDASDDNSLDILNDVIKDYPERKAFIKIIRLKENGGVSNARRVGMTEVTGNYVIHADSDDWVDNDMYESLYNIAEKAQADVVGCNFYHEFPDRKYVLDQPYADSVKENIRLLICGTLHPSLCTSLIKTSIITENDIVFPIGLDMGEDLLFNLNVYLQANKIIKNNTAPYHYRHDHDSSSFRLKKQSVYSAIEISRRVEELMRSKNLYNEYKMDIEYRKFSMKYALVWDFKNKRDYKEWLNIFPETHKYIWGFKQIEWKLRLELWLAAHHMYYLAKAIVYGLKLQHKIRYFLTSSRH